MHVLPEVILAHKQGQMPFVVLGDSLSDNGACASLTHEQWPRGVFAKQRFTDDLTWSGLLSRDFGARHVTVLAHGGATLLDHCYDETPAMTQIPIYQDERDITLERAMSKIGAIKSDDGDKYMYKVPSIMDQITKLGFMIAVGDLVVTTDTIVVLAGGTNDYFFDYPNYADGGLEPTEVCNRITDMLSILNRMGFCKFIVADTEPISKTPWALRTKTICDDHERVHTNELEVHLKRWAHFHSECTLKGWSIYDALNRAIDQNCCQTACQNVTEMACNQDPYRDPDRATLKTDQTYLWFDEFHPSSHGHRALYASFLTVLKATDSHGSMLS